MIVPSVRISPKRHVPALYIGKRGLFPHEYIRIAWQMRDWKIAREAGDLFTVRFRENALHMTAERMSTMICEWKMWERCYLPGFSVEGKTVLDVGAGCGETTYFYFQHGAGSVTAVETDPIQLELLKTNAALNGWNGGAHDLKIIPRAFDLQDLKQEKFDFAKMDIEGGEADLLKLDTIDFPLIVEAHGRDLRDRLIQKFGLSVIVRPLPLEDVWLLGNQEKQ